MKNIKDIDKEHYAKFYSMKELVQAMLVNPKVWSWGAEDYANIEDLFLRFKVNGHHLQGWIYIGVNGLDLFEVFFTNRSGEIVDEMLDVYIDELIDKIDEKVEKIPGYRW